jgi:hypothetical protein
MFYQVLQIAKLRIFADHHISRDAVSMEGIRLREGQTKNFRMY